MKVRVALSLLAVMVGCLICLSPGAAATSEEQHLLTLVNQYRADNGVGPLTFHPALEHVAAWEANDQTKFHDLQHTDSLGRDLKARECGEGYCYNTYGGEDLAGGYDTAEGVLAAWKASPSHNAVLLDPHYFSVGISEVYNSASPFVYYWALETGGVCPGDINGDGRISTSDVIKFGRHYGQPVDSVDDYSYDLNEDGRVNTADIIVLGPLYNQHCGD